MTLRRVTHDPDAILSYGLNWADFGPNDGSDDDTGWLQGETIAESQWIISGPDSPTITDQDHSTVETKFQISGATEGSTYLATNRIQTAAGYQDDRTIEIVVEQR
jgi:hypothetical protein